MSFDAPTVELTVCDRLLDAAERVVARDGVSNLTLEAVAREAGVSKGGLLYHFPSKSDLIVAFVERIGARCEAKQLAEVEPPGTPGAFTRAYLNIRTQPVDPQERPIKTALLAAAATDKRYLDPIRKRAEDWQRRLETDGIDPAAATIVRLAIDGMCLCSMFGFPVPEGELRSQVIEKLLAMTKNGNEGNNHA
jgi:AcrR family transcriptional regulator